MRNFIFLFVVLCFASPYVVRAQELSFVEAVTIALAESYDVQRAHLDVLSAKTDQLKTFAQIGPTFRLKYSDTTNREAFFAPIGPNGQDVLVQPLQSKQTTVSIGMNLTAVVAGLVKVWSDGWTVDTSEKARELAQIETAFAVAQIYRMTQQAERQLEVAKTRLEATKKQQRDTESLYAHGKISKADKLQIDFNANSSALGVINAENEWLNAQATLKKILNRDSTEPLILEKMKDLNDGMIPELGSPSDSIVKALSCRKDLQFKQLTVSSLEGSRWLNFASYLPLVSLESNWDWNLNGSTFSRSNSQYMTLNASWKFWDNGDALLDFRKTHLAVRKARIDAREKTVDVKIDVERSLRNLKLAKETLSARNTGLKQAQEAYRGIEARYALGKISVTNFLFAENTLHQAKLDHLAATVGIDVAYMNLQKALGEKKPVAL